MADDDTTLDFLTDEERAALDESDFVEDHHEQGEGDADAAIAALGEGGEGGEAEQADKPEEQAQEVAAQVPEVDLSAIDADLAALGVERKALLAKYDDGDLTGEELEQELEGIATKHGELSGQRAIAAHAEEQETNRWTSTVGSYLESNPGFKDSDDVMRAFDAVVRTVTGSPAYASMSYQKQLEAAHEMLAVQARQTGLKGVPAFNSKDEAKPTPKGDDPDMRTPPPSLARAPASDISGVSSSPYTQLEQLVEAGDSDAIEAAYARLTPEQRDEFSSRSMG